MFLKVLFWRGKTEVCLFHIKAQSVDIPISEVFGHKNRDHKLEEIIPTKIAQQRSQISTQERKLPKIAFEEEKLNSQVLWLG